MNFALALLILIHAGAIGVGQLSGEMARLNIDVQASKYDYNQKALLYDIGNCILLSLANGKRQYVPFLIISDKIHDFNGQWMTVSDNLIDRHRIFMRALMDIYNLKKCMKME